MALIENIQREDLNAIDEAKAYRRLVEEFALTRKPWRRRWARTARPWPTRCVC